MNAPEIQVVAENRRILRAEGKTLFASSGYRIMRSDDGGSVWELDGEVKNLSPVNCLSSRSPLLEQIIRGGVFDVLSLPGGERVAVCKGMIARAGCGSRTYVPVFRFSRGSRPLNLCLEPGGTIYWGEYFLNLRRREPVRIYASRDAGLNWEVAYEFRAGEVCHVHRIFHDPYDGSLVVTTGDRDAESFIFRSSDGLGTLEVIAGGAQHFRTASVVPVPGGLLYGTDDPDGQNHIILLKREGGYAAEVTDVPGPVMYGTLSGGKAVFTTMQENDEHEVSIWSGDESGFLKIMNIPVKQTSRLWREISGYPRVLLPNGISSENVIFATPVGTDQYANALISLKL